MGRGARVDGMASICELLINIVNQNGGQDADTSELWWVYGVMCPVTWAGNTTGG
jgi:hypothetical protein